MPSPPTRSASTANASGTFGSGTCDQPRGTGSTMLSALKSRATWGSSLTPFSPKSHATTPSGGHQRLRPRHAAAGTMPGAAAAGRGRSPPRRRPHRARRASPGRWVQAQAAADTDKRVRPRRWCPPSRAHQPCLRRHHLQYPPAAGISDHRPDSFPRVFPGRGQDMPLVRGRP